MKLRIMSNAHQFSRNKETNFLCNIRFVCEKFMNYYYCSFFVYIILDIRSNSCNFLQSSCPSSFIELNKTDNNNSGIIHYIYY